MLSSWSCLLVTLLGALMAQNSEAAGVCGAQLQQVQVRPFNNQDFDKVEDDWYVVAAYESHPRFFENVQCFHIHYHKTDEPNVFEITRHERFINQTRVQYEGRKVIEQNNSALYQYDIEQDSAAILPLILLDYSVNAPSDMNNYLIYYACVPGQGQEEDYTVFISLSRQYCATQPTVVTAVTKQALDRVGLGQEKTETFFDEVCGVEDPIWTTTASE